LAGERPGHRIQSSAVRGIRGVARGVTNPAFIAAVAAPAVAALLTLVFVIPTLAPGVASWDTAEFQTVGPLLGTAHATGYPSYTILGWLASIVLQPFGDPAYRMNLLQALLAATAVASTAGIVQILTGRRLIAIATGMMFLVMPFVSSDVSVPMPMGAVTPKPVFWDLSTHADPHMFHVALAAMLFVVLLVWDKRRRSDEPATSARADRWLVAAAAIFGVAVTNHSLSVLLAPAVGIFVLVADPRVLLRGRTILACFAVLLGTMVVLFAELPIRAAMHAPIVYGHPDTWSGFLYVILGQQFTGSLADPFGNLSDKYAGVMALFSGWLGPVGVLAVIGFGTSLIRRPRFVILTGLAAVAACIFSASYANADIQRYYLVPLLVAFTWAGLATADILALIGWFASELELPGKARVAEKEAAEAAGPVDTAEQPATPAIDSTPAARPVRLNSSWAPTVVLVGELVIAAVLVYSTVGLVPARQMPQNGATGAVSQANNTGDEAWVRLILSPVNQGGLPENSVIMAWWSDSTRLWYGQKVLGLRPDIYVVDDRTRLDANMGEVQDVFNKYLGNRPVYTIRLSGGVDGLSELGAEYDMESVSVGGGPTITHVIRRKGSQ
jgi:hypothetical protein